MADLAVLRVMVLTYTSLLFFSLVNDSAAFICPERQYLNSRLQLCMNCTDCQDGTVVLRPCEMHRDTHCGPISAIGDLLKSITSNNPHRHHHDKHHHQRNHHHENTAHDRYDELQGSETVQEPAPTASEVTSSEAPFSSAETLVWDWQAIALTSAVFACILFFLVIALYSLHQAKQWRRLKDNFEADVEELSARLSLMAAVNNEKEDFREVCGGGGRDGAASPDANYLNNRCVYLEQLLSVRKEGKVERKPKGNVYIEENKSKT